MLLRLAPGQVNALDIWNGPTQVCRPMQNQPDAPFPAPAQSRYGQLKVRSPGEGRSAKHHQ